MYCFESRRSDASRAWIRWRRYERFSAVHHSIASRHSRICSASVPGILATSSISRFTSFAVFAFGIAAKSGRSVTSSAASFSDSRRFAYSAESASTAASFALIDSSSDAAPDSIVERYPAIFSSSVGSTSMSTAIFEEGERRGLGERSDERRGLRDGRFCAEYEMHSY